MRPRVVNFPAFSLAMAASKIIAYTWPADAIVRLLDAHLQPGSVALPGDVDLRILTDSGSSGLIVGETGPTACTLAALANRPRRTPTDTNRRDGVVLARYAKLGEIWRFEFTNRGVGAAIVSLQMAGDFTA